MARQYNSPIRKAREAAHNLKRTLDDIAAFERREERKAKQKSPEAIARRLRIRRRNAEDRRKADMEAAGGKCCRCNREPQKDDKIKSWCIEKRTLSLFCKGCFKKLESQFPSPQWFQLFCDWMKERGKNFKRISAEHLTECVAGFVETMRKELSGGYEI